MVKILWYRRKTGRYNGENKMGEMDKKYRFYVLWCFAVTFILIFSGNALAAKDRGNAVSKNLLPKELKNATLYDYFLESNEKEVAEIQAKEGNVIVAKPDLKRAYFAASGDKLFAKDVIFTLKKSRCKFKLITEDVVSMGAQAKLNIKEVVDDRENQSKSSLFGMAKGMAIFNIIHVSRYFKQSMEVETPTAVSGVRGSKFGVEVKRASGKSSASRPVMLADASENGFIYLAEAQKEKNGTVTVVHGLEGKVEVKSKEDNSIQFLNPGQSIEATLKGLSKVFETPAKAIKQFMDSVEINIQKATKELEKSSKAVEKKMKTVEKKMETPFGVLDKLGKDIEKKFK
jgi:hypothetical protein